MDLEYFKRAKSLIEPYIKKTPIIKLHKTIYLKCENLQITNSFKVRGAFNALLHLTKEQKKVGVVTRSSGNFAQALAYAGKELGIPVTIVMPRNVPQVKYEKTAAYLPTIVLADTRQAEEDMVKKIGKEKGLVMLSPYDYLDVIAGQGTIGLEIMEQLPSVKYIFCPLGGGGLMGGISNAVKEQNPKIQTVAIEPIGGNDYYLSRQQKHKVRLSSVNTIADGLRAPEVGNLNYPLLEKYVDHVELVSDDMIKEAMKLLYDETSMIVEPSAAASVAGCLHTKLPIKGDIVCVLSGGNVDLENFYEWIKI